MSNDTEIVMNFQPGLVFDSLNDSDMVLDGNSGEYVPWDQVVHDPLHTKKLTHLDEEPEDGEEGDAEPEIDSSNQGDPEDVGATFDNEGAVTSVAKSAVKFQNPEKELAALIAEQEADMSTSDARPPKCNRKGLGNK